MFLIAMIIAVGATAVSSTLNAARSTDRFQQGTGIVVAALEEGRDIEFNALTVDSSDSSLYTDTDLSGVYGSYKFDPDGDGPLSSEPLITESAGSGISTHLTTETHDGLEFTIGRYVTWADSEAQGGSNHDYKRLTVVVSWTIRGVEHSYRSSTVVAEPGRIPGRPDWVLGGDIQSLTVNPGDIATFSHTLTNNDQADTFGFTVDATETPGWDPVLYGDDGDGVWTKTDPAVARHQC